MERLWEEAVPGEQPAESECPICFTDPPHTVLLPCTHTVCKDCAIQLREATRKKNEKVATSRSNRKKKWASYTCPVCRQRTLCSLFLLVVL